MSQHTLTINGQSRTVEAPDEMPLLWVLRDLLHLYGTKFSCGAAQCGACTIHVDGEAVMSCQFPVGKAGGRQILTIEGLSPDGSHPLQKAWCEVDVAQCGYCQPGQIMTAAALLKKNPKPTDKDINLAMNGVLCRCSTYSRIRFAIKVAAGLASAQEGQKLSQSAMPDHQGEKQHEIA